MARVHLILQGKGGVGKSYVAFVLAQYLQFKECKTIFLDTDPVNQTFVSVSSLGVEKFNITYQGEVDQRTFDKLFERVLEADSDSEIVIDTGSSGYVPLVSYLIENNIIESLCTAPVLASIF